MLKLLVFKYQPTPTLKVQPKTFIDISSHNGEISVDDYRALAR
ncbi:hypothetical protein [Streptococcus thermophilus]